MKNYKKLIVALTLITGTLFLTSCEEAEEDLLKEAQLCLNKATASEALACVTKITSNTTQTAYNLRCSAAFIAQGKADADQILEALKGLSEPGNCTGGCSPTVNVMTAFKFTDRDIANYAFDNCLKASSKIYTQLASIIKLGTIVYIRAFANTTPLQPVADDFKEALTNDLLPQDVDDIGGAISAAYGIACSEPADKQSQGTKDFCSEVKKAIDGGSSDNDIGTCFVEKLKNPGYSSGSCI
jgi:hypothetical protein